MSIALLVTTDGRDECLARTLASFEQMVSGPITRRVIHDDTGDPKHAAWLSETYPEYAIAATPQRSGFGGAIQSAWTSLDYLGNGAQWVLGLEDDFVFRRPVDLTAMVAALEANPRIVQMVLRRQPWNDAERAAGGIVEQDPDRYVDMCSVHGEWLEHRNFFSTNPALYRRTLCKVGWPDGQYSEGRFGLKLLEHGSPEASAEDLRFAFWGSRDSGVWVEHIGAERVGTGY